MAGESKKISFAFNKLTKKTNIYSKPPARQKNVELIDCLESHTIKLKNSVKEVKTALVIPMVKASPNLLDQKRESRIKSKLKLTNTDMKPDSELTADELAARELLRDVQNASAENEVSNIYKLGVVDDVNKIEDKEEPTLDDYESVPISQYGMAMLRGMGWSENTGIGKNGRSIMNEPILRPKGMGLGVNIKTNQKRLDEGTVDKSGKKLLLKKGGCAKIIDGKQKGNYCEVQGFDDEAGRVIVKTSLQGLMLSLNEFLVKPVTKEEYMKSSDVIDNVKEEHEANIKTEKEHNPRFMSDSHKKERRSSSKSESSSSQQIHLSNSKKLDHINDSEHHKCGNNKEQNDYKYKKEFKEKHSNRYSSIRAENDKEKRSSVPSVSNYQHEKYRSATKKIYRSKHRSSSDSDSDRDYKRNYPTSTKR